MSFLDRIPGLRRKSTLPDGVEHVMLPESTFGGLVKTGKWVVHLPTKVAGILVNVQDFPNCRVMLVDEAGFDLRPITCHLTEVRLAKHAEIPLSRRPSADIAASLGYY
jgi:hypothetical protein